MIEWGLKGCVVVHVGPGHCGQKEQPDNGNTFIAHWEDTSLKSSLTCGGLDFSSASQQRHGWYLKKEYFLCRPSVLHVPPHTKYQ